MDKNGTLSVKKPTGKWTKKLKPTNSKTTHKLINSKTNKLKTDKSTNSKTTHKLINSKTNKLKTDKPTNSKITHQLINSKTQPHK